MTLTSGSRRQQRNFWSLWVVTGVDCFRAHFADHEHRRVLIGGAARELIIGEAGPDFRATKVTPAPAKAVANLSGSRYIVCMAKQSSSTRSSRTGMFVTLESGSRSRNVKTRLGNVTVSGKKPSAELVQTNVARSTQALERVGKKLIKPGIHLPQKRGVPRYSADENNPGVIIRRLDGQITTGRLENGQFVEIE